MIVQAYLLVIQYEANKPEFQMEVISLAKSNDQHLWSGLAYPVVIYVKTIIDVIFILAVSVVQQIIFVRKPSLELKFILLLDVIAILMHFPFTQAIKQYN